MFGGLATGDHGFKDNLVLCFHIRDKMCVSINGHYKHSLIRIFLPIRVLDVVKQPVSLEEEDHILKRDTTLFNKLLIFIGVSCRKASCAGILAQCVPFGIIFLRLTDRNKRCNLLRPLD